MFVIYVKVAEIVFLAKGEVLLLGRSRELVLDVRAQESAIDAREQAKTQYGRRRRKNPDYCSLLRIENVTAP